MTAISIYIIFSYIFGLTYSYQAGAQGLGLFQAVIVAILSPVLMPVMAGMAVNDILNR